jgi:hypothetical protein
MKKKLVTQESRQMIRHRRALRIEKAAES